MKLDQLLAREDFLNIFADTISNYLEIQEGWVGEISWSSTPKEGLLNLLVNKKLNLIFPDSCSTEDLRNLASEYSYNKNFLKRLLQSIYVSYSVSRPLRNLVSRGYIQISPMPKFFLNFCILPGNHFIRIIDLSLQQCVVLFKKGHSIDYLEKIVSIRKKFPDIPGPMLLESNVSEGWFIEERVFGTPINRLSSQDKYRSTMSAAKKFMLRMYKNTEENFSTSTWLGLKEAEFYKAISSLPDCYENDTSLLASQLFSVLIEELRSLSHKDFFIETVWTHGDFQEANILVPHSDDDQSVYLIDWEYSARRSRYYDVLVLGLNSRSPKGLAERITLFVNNISFSQEILETWDIKEIFPPELRILTFTFLIEDFLFRLEDTTIPKLKEPSQGFLDFLNEINSLKDKI